MSTNSKHRPWPDYPAFLRWHFYAGVFCIPFVIWLASTGLVYLFRSDIEAMLDRPYENLRLEATRPPPSAEVAAAINAVGQSQLDKYVLPATASGAAQVVVSSKGKLWRVYVDPRNLQPMKILRDDRRPMEVVSNLHGNLLAGTSGSILVEIAASWAIVLIITGLYLWFPRDRAGVAGVLYPRLANRGRPFWRDLHAVSGAWVSIFVLFMLLSGLPWSFAWGSYLSWARELSTVTSGTPNWTVGGSEAKRTTAASNDEQPRAMAGMSPTEMAAMSTPSSHMSGMSDTDHQAMVDRRLDVVVPAALKLRVPPPVQIQPSASAGGDWAVTSDNQNRLKRVTYMLSALDGSVVSRSSFNDQNVVDRVVNVGISAHVGQLFGRINQAVLVFMATSLIVMMVSAVVMWLRRKPDDTLGAPRPGARPRTTGWLLATILMLAVLMPLFGLTLIGVVVIERTLLRRLPGLRRWFGLPESARS